MFTIKFYDEGNHRTRIMSADSFTVLRGLPGDGGQVEITLHQKNSSEDQRIDLFDPRMGSADMPKITYSRAVIENAQGRTTEIIKAAADYPMVSPGIKSGENGVHRC